MRIFVVSILLFLSVFTVSAQTHEEALKEFAALKEKAEKFKTELEKDSARVEKVLLQPDKADLFAAERENVNVFRILPREVYDNGVFKVRGGGAYYSFTNKSHSYDETPQIELQQGHLSVGFAGADYGFIADLERTPLSDINFETKGVDYLVNYKPPTEEKDARVEQRKVQARYEQNGNVFSSRLKVTVGNTYILRAISYREADTAVAIKIHRQDADGSLIIFWKLLKNFEKPILNNNVSAK